MNSQNNSFPAGSITCAMGFGIWANDWASKTAVVVIAKVGPKCSRRLRIALFFSLMAFPALSVRAQYEEHYGRMFGSSQAPTPQYIDKMEKLGRSMLGTVEKRALRCTSATAKAGYTYFGQFIDHDVSFDPVFLADLPTCDPDKIVNGRSPWFDLDQVYGGGPAISKDLYEGLPGEERFKIANKADLPLGKDYKLIGDQRDFRDLENAILLQLHVAFMKLHNIAVLQRLDCGVPEVNQKDITPFAKAARLVRWQYQRLIQKDYLRVPINDAVWGHAARFQWNDGRFFIPLEFSSAAFRFGHSMVRDTYKLNTRTPEKPLVDLMSVDLATNPLPSELVIQWGHFFSGVQPENRLITTAPAKPVDTSIAPDLGRIPRYTARIFSNRAIPPVDKKTDLADVPELPARTLIRGAYLRLPTGQQVATALNLPQLTVEQLTGATNRLANGRPDASGQMLLKLGLERETPLFYYLMREAETKLGCGNHLGTIGSQIVADVIGGALLHDPEGYLKRAGKEWEPPRWGFPDGSSRQILKLADVMSVVADP